MTLDDNPTFWLLEDELDIRLEELLICLLEDEMVFKFDDELLLDSSWLSPLRMTLDDDFAFWLLEDETVFRLEEDRI
jgi:hypothetical protein